MKFVAMRHPSCKLCTYISEGSLEVKLPTILTDEKQRWEVSEKRREEKKKEDRKVEKQSCQSGGCKAIWANERLSAARRCGAKHISKSKCTRHLSLRVLLGIEMLEKCMPLWREVSFEVRVLKHQMFEPVLVVGMLKKCAQLWREAHVEVKMYKTHHAWSTCGNWEHYYKNY